MMNWRYDHEADAAYLRLTDAKVVESDEVADDIVIDLDADNKIVGIEVLHASRRLADSILHPAAAE
ncbi:hypothetical protein X907_1796 [Glycocaulis alkaliphilus]|uniref:DUF2283 domain-containing protein n=2 Tax=Glycocaulis alkaliphilus TaxID=1434191 RepID=A0A3T0EAT5_9PROT|nr:hypothetical protein X907_1796 [Glycocaulis alkaliphilus]